MTVAQSAADVLSEHVEFDLECIDRMYLNVYVPILQAERGIAFYWQSFRGYKFASSALMKEKTDAFINSISQFIEAEDIPVVRFTKGIRKDDVAKEYLANFKGREGVLFVGKAQEKAKVVRTERRRNPATGATYPWLVRTTSVVNQYYFYCIDEDFGPFFIKFCSYFPYNAKLCINGHEYLKRQLAKRGLKFEALDNGILSCEDPKRMQRLADGLTPKKIDDLLRKWFRKLPHPFSAADRRARFLYDVSILQAEFALTQVLDRPLSGRVFFEQMIRENIDLGRPDQVQLIFDRRIVKNTPGRFRTRVLTDGVIPSLHIDYKSSRIKQYHKKGRALRTETVINNTYDFRVPRKLKNLPQLREVGLSANRRLLDVQRLSFDATIGEDAFNDIARPVRRECGPPVAALRFGDPRVMALFAGLVVFGLLPCGFSNRDLREYVAPLLGLDLSEMTQGKMTYDLRRLRYHGLIERVPKTHRYRVTPFGSRAALFLSRAYIRLLRPGLSMLEPSELPARIGRAMVRFDEEVERILLRHSPGKAA